jgi:hypothetical protein
LGVFGFYLIERICPDDEGSDERSVLNVTVLVNMLRRFKGLEISGKCAAVGTNSVGGISEIKDSANGSFIIESVAEEAQCHGLTAAQIKIKGTKVSWAGQGKNKDNRSLSEWSSGGSDR